MAFLFLKACRRVYIAIIYPLAKRIKKSDNHSRLFPGYLIQDIYVV
jgi:hypothetical protein